MSCQKVGALLEAYVDGELTPDQTLEVEQHLAECGACTEEVRFELSLRRSLQRVVHVTPNPEAALRRRVMVALAEERGVVPQASWMSRTVRWPHWRGVTAFAAAAVITLMWTSRGDESLTNSALRAGAAGIGRADATEVEHLIDDLVNEHAATSRPDVRSLQMARTFEQEVGIPIRVPQLRQVEAAWIGGKLVAPGGQQMAAFQYDVAGHRVTVYMFDPRRSPVRAQLEARVFRDTPVYQGRHRGYSIAAIERQGVGYVVATDLGDDESAEIILNTVMH